MLDELREEEIIKKVGGRFRLSTLMQKRLVALNGGGRPLVETTGDEDKLQIVIREIMQDKIYLDSKEKLQVAETEFDATEPSAFEPPEFDLDQI
jgi:DNA-directed RNA polymerase subunit omega